MKKNYKMVVSYDGSRYKGWQRLKDQDLTVQGKLQEVLDKLEGEFVDVTGSGRTDAGVHALNQVANFHLSVDMTPKEIHEYLNRYLPDDIAVISVKEASDRFHARFNALNKTYRYTIRTSPVLDVFRRKYEYQYVDHPLDLDAMKRAAGHLTGTHDFMSFCGNNHIKKSTERTLYSIDIKRDNDLVIIDFTGNGFLQNMVRILTGTLIEVGAGLRDADSMPSLLSVKKRSEAGFMAPAKGLTLLKVVYPEES